MLATLKVIELPEVYAADVDLAARHARVDNDAELDLFSMYLGAATSLAEKYLGRALITQTLQWNISEISRTSGIQPLGTPFDWALQRLHHGIVEIPYSPVQSVVSVSCGAWGQPDTVLLPDVDYTADTLIDPARLRLDPSVGLGSFNRLSVMYVAGYGSTASSIPRPIVNAVMMLATNLFENRGDDDRGGMSKAVQSLLNPFRLQTYA